MTNDMKRLNATDGAGEWDEQKHPRDNEGKFDDKGNSGAPAKVDKGLVEFVKNIDSLPDKAQYVVGEVSERERRDIERLTGEKLNAMQHVINASEIRHIITRHGEKGAADKTMSNIDDYGLINSVIKNYDSLDFVRDNKGNVVKATSYFITPTEKAQLIKYEKVNSDSVSFVVEALTDTKKGVLHIISAYKKEKTLN